MNNKVKGYAAGILAAIFYGTNPLGALPLYADGINSATVLFYRYGLALVMFAIWMVAAGESFKIKWGHMIRLAMLGVFFAMSSCTLFLSFLYMDAGVASTILFSYPIMTAVLMMLFYHEHLKWGTALAIALAVVGIVLLYHGDGGEKLSAFGLMLVLMSSLLYAIYIVAVNQFHFQMSPVKFTFWVILFGFLSIVAFSFAADEPIPLLHGTRQWGFASLLALMPTVLSLYFMNIAIPRIGSTPASIMGALEPVTAVVISCSLFGEPFTLRLCIGIVLILTAVIIVILKK